VCHCEEGEARRSNLSLDCFGLKPSQPSGLLRHGVYTERSECVPRNDTVIDCNRLLRKIARNDTKGILLDFSGEKRYL